MVSAGDKKMPNGILEEQGTRGPVSCRGPPAPRGPRGPLPGSATSTAALPGEGLALTALGFRRCKTVLIFSLV